MSQVKTPCIGICSTTSLGDKICRGCKRFNFEVIRWNSYSPYCWLHGLLQKYAYRIKSLDEIGVQLTAAYRGRELGAVMQEANEELHRLSEAHFERYFQP